MALPAFLTQQPPPRSPHVAPPSAFSYFHAGAPATSRPSLSIRPSRRDLILVLLTLSFSYLLFSTNEPPTRATTTVDPPSRYKLSDWSQLWRGGSHTDNGVGGSCGPVEIREKTFGESVKSYGVSRASLAEGADELDRGAKGEFWDGGEESAEDDELEAISTVLKGHQPGWTIFERLYIYNGSFYVVTDTKADWPALRMMTSTGLPANNTPGNGEAREPTGNEIRFITPLAAMKLWGPRVLRLDGMSWLINDGQFLDHYYHFAAELLLGMWRTYASLDQDITADGITKLPAPQRMWYLHQSPQEWRDKPRFNSVLSFALFPSTSMLYPDDFDDLKRVTSEGQQKAFMMERAILADRSAAFRGPYTGPTSRTVASALYVGTTSRWWWEPIRRQMLRYASVGEAVINRNLEGYGATDPVLTARPGVPAAAVAAPAGAIAGPGPGLGPAVGAHVGPGVGVGVTDLEPHGSPAGYKPIVTYISRQSSRRRLTAESHTELVKIMEERAKKLDFEFLVIEAEKLSKEEQIAIAAKTTIMLGVHGNGLTHLIWMPPTPRSTVIELFYKGGFARDYQWTAHALGIRHFAIQHDVAFTAPHLPEVAYPEGFQGTAITVVGKVVADLVEDRLSGKGIY